MQGSEINGVAHNSTLWSFKTEIILKKHKYALETKWQPQRDNRAIIFASRNKAILSCEWFLLSILCWEGTCLRGNQFPGACHPLPTLESNRESRWDPKKETRASSSASRLYIEEPFMLSHSVVFNIL